MRARGCVYVCARMHVSSPNRAPTVSSFEWAKGGCPICTLKLAFRIGCSMCNMLSSLQLHNLLLLLFAPAESERESDILIVVFLLLGVIFIMYTQNHVIVQFRGAVLLRFLLFFLRALCFMRPICACSPLGCASIRVRCSRGIRRRRRQCVNQSLCPPSAFA